MLKTNSIITLNRRQSGLWIGEGRRLWPQIALPFSNVAQLNFRFYINDNNSLSFRIANVQSVLCGRPGVGCLPAYLNCRIAIINFTLTSKRELCEHARTWSFQHAIWLRTRISKMPIQHSAICSRKQCTFVRQYAILMPWCMCVWECLVDSSLHGFRLAYWAKLFFFCVCASTDYIN